MSFLDNFSFAFQDIVLLLKNTVKGIYGENIKDSETIINFKGVIQEKSKFGEFSFDTNNNLSFTSKDFELRSNIDITPKKGDYIESNGNEYKVIYTEKILIEGKHDHNLSIIRLID